MRPKGGHMTRSRRTTGTVWPATLFAMAVGAAFGLAAAPQTRTEQPAVVRVGIDEGDVGGADHRALQAAVDYVAGLGGGTVHIGPGRYLMRNALKLRDNIRVVGVPGQTVLVACDGFTSALTADGDANERQITLADPAGFRVGDGVAVQQQGSGGFEVTTATLTAQVGPNSFQIGRAACRG